MKQNFRGIIEDCIANKQITDSQLLTLFLNDFKTDELYAAADSLRKILCGDRVTYVRNLNINFTNICINNCLFCAFKAQQQDKGFNLSNEQITAKVAQAEKAGITEVCIQGGLHPNYGLTQYAEILKAVKRVSPRVHIHAFSPMEIKHAADMSGKSYRYVLEFLISNGLGSMPGTAAEILDDTVREKICPGKLSTDQWVEIITTAHKLGLKTTATIMFGHLEAPTDIVTHLKLIKKIQAQTGNFTEFIPLPFIPYNTVLGQKYNVTPIPTSETFKLLAISRLYFGTLIPNIQVSWPKIGPEAAMQSLSVGVNDIGGTLMEESISKSAGAKFGDFLHVDKIVSMIQRAGRIPIERDTMYNLYDNAAENG